MFLDEEVGITASAIGSVPMAPEGILSVETKEQWQMSLLLLKDGECDDILSIFLANLEIGNQIRIKR